MVHLFWEHKFRGIFVTKKTLYYSDLLLLTHRKYEASYPRLISRITKVTQISSDIIRLRLWVIFCRTPFFFLHSFQKTYKFSTKVFSTDTIIGIKARLRIGRFGIRIGEIFSFQKSRTTLEPRGNHQWNKQLRSFRGKAAGVWSGPFMSFIYPTKFTIILL